MPLLNFDLLANELPAAWKSAIVGSVGTARIKVLRMDGTAYEAETHDYDEGLLVMSGQLMLEVAGDVIEVGAGQMYLALAGTPHAVREGSHGTLVIVDV
ncbi:cupin domain-containing protein [Paraburkholderia phenazinium]|uniref:Mannose-6-phosphate isomerase, cupin superfamily n=1 Tax=Paraburkholderia phenazinium TaxID=60549 RepID=A0A1G7YZI4_9BURK|nr:cupin domain-containing protein [Paraburkholderia phenazinium]SDH01817.1 Mannose-6-phosphate isomerase, cupin superfamily [Paraburkholderia phenazinium]